METCPKDSKLKKATKQNKNKDFICVKFEFKSKKIIFKRNDKID
jgi:hypothetical protein